MNATTRFSKSTGSFYPFSENYPALPADVIDVPIEDYHAAVIAMAQGDTLDIIDGRVAVIPKPAATKAELQASAWEAIKAERDRRKAGGVKVGAKWFHSDEASKIQQIGLVMMGASIPAGLMWKTMDGSFVTMTPALAGQVFAAVVAHEQAVFAAAETHNAAMKAAADPAVYDFSSGWPASYVEATP